MEQNNFYLAEFIYLNNNVKLLNYYLITKSNGNIYDFIYIAKNKNSKINKIIFLDIVFSFSINNSKLLDRVSSSFENSEKIVFDFNNPASASFQLVPAGK